MNKEAEECDSVHVDMHKKVIVSHRGNASEDLPISYILLNVH